MSNGAAWDTFELYLKDLRKRMEDQWAPVALICLQATRDGDDTLLRPFDDAAVLWPKDFPAGLRGPLLARLALPYHEDRVLRG